MRNIMVVVEYDGTDYCGFQLQANALTIQEELERVLSKIVEEKVRVTGSGRTDTGVHAAGQVINFRTRGTIPIDKLCIAMNTLLPVAISAKCAAEVEDDFHARYSAKSRLYRYDILNRDVRSALEGRFVWHLRTELDVESMRKGAKHLIGGHDFTSFCCADRDDGSAVRNLTELDIIRDGEHVIFMIRANAFLRSMVRVIVGTLVEVGLGKTTACDIGNILDARDRRAAGRTAPPSGLTLMSVDY